MPFIPHTQGDVAAMLERIGAPSIAALFDEIPPALLGAALAEVPAGANEMQVARLMQERAEADGRWLGFLGAGAYEHHIPAAVWQIVTRGEFYTAYTPYQAEASQGTLQLLYEFQTMMASLTGMDVSNASLYDGASALGEAVLMAVRAVKSGARRVLLPRSVHPLYRSAVRAIVGQQGIELTELPFDAAGRVDRAALDALGAAPFAALVLAQPNFFGVIEDPADLTDWAHSRGALVIAAVNPTALALLEPPGRWGERGADICCGEAQPLGIPLSGGGPYLGFLTCKSALVRQLPGRLIGRTLDLDGKPGFTLTLQAREQHIRRSKATSNICTNQGLMVTAATIYLALTGAAGLERVALASHANANRLAELLCAIPGVTRIFAAPHFHELALRLPKPVAPVLEALLARRIVGGFDLAADYPELGNALLVCATETKTAEDMLAYADALRAALAAAEGAPC
ncbi:MAG TPA: aminomethyl-transferring glycine dehydrogenase subunit GcvPA [Rhodocyclaceae bacterium]|nr:aminomethyl-transferring glycine dehydrogenase subunit GcvPA [Rhodocyclaceae bacterium]